MIGKTLMFFSGWRRICAFVLLFSFPFFSFAADQKNEEKDTLQDEFFFGLGLGVASRKESIVVSQPSIHPVAGVVNSEYKEELSGTRANFHIFCGWVAPVVQDWLLGFQVGFCTLGESKHSDLPL